jgi:hypothetical protein
MFKLVVKLLLNKVFPLGAIIVFLCGLFLL